MYSTPMRRASALGLSKMLEMMHSTPMKRASASGLLKWRTVACPNCSACSSGVPPLAYSCRTHQNRKHIDGSGSC
ncbi:unnamed protein product [Sphagnum tenellum]